MKSINDTNDVVLHRFTPSVSDISPSVGKRRETVRRSKAFFSVDDQHFANGPQKTLCFLKQFCIRLLTGGFFGRMMKTVFQALNRSEQRHSQLRKAYMWSLFYFGKFDRITLPDNSVFVREFVSIHTFHFIQTEIDMYLEMLASDKGKERLWSNR
ncbi:unnamed protein product [Soboliphyme baturini]|uniref:Transposase n=1 Tax=Soboliphyme baturini TaxID=241478 RepID=A0A183IAC1_9BILA|nr:unnamed protein product [Soboliphyme baturini]